MTVNARKVLMLHGYSQNASIFNKRMGAVRKQCGAGVEFVFVDAPHILTEADLQGSTTEPETSRQTDPALAPRGWWTKGTDWNNILGLEESILFLRDVLHSGGKFDGIFGFSQGAAMAAMMAGLLEKPDQHPSFLIDEKPPHPPVLFCIAASGFVANDPFGRSLVSPSYETPTLHVIGETDQLVVHERSMELVNVSKNARVEMHDGGHFVPSKANWRRFFKEYISDPLNSGVLPPVTSSTPASGTATPNQEHPVTSSLNDPKPASL